MKVLLDTNIVLDVLLQREPFCQEAKEIFVQIESGQQRGFLCATTITTIYYLVCKTTTVLNANNIIQKLLLLFEITNVNKDVLQHALQNSGKDFEDSVIYTSAELCGIDVIISRDLKGFKKVKSRNKIAQRVFGYYEIKRKFCSFCFYKNEQKFTPFSLLLFEYSLALVVQGQGCHPLSWHF